jgi:hypothetical protein
MAEGWKQSNAGDRFSEILEEKTGPSAGLFRNFASQLP